MTSKIKPFVTIAKKATVERHTWLTIGTVFLPLIIFLAGCNLALADLDVQALLQRSDHARGGGLPGIVWKIRLIAYEGDEASEEQYLEVQAVDNASLATTLEPARFRGTKLLQVERNMWLTKPGLSKPISISARQRMLGQAANGDIAATNYAKDYTATLAGEDMINGEACYVLELKARHNRTTYDRVRYWVTKNREVALKAKFYALSGKLLKTASFEYNQVIHYAGKNIPFVSRMLIRDGLTDAYTDMHYSDVQVRIVSPAEFALGQMQ